MSFFGARKPASRNVLVFGTSAVARAAAREFERRGYTVIRFTETNEYANLGRSLRTTLRASEIVAEAKPTRIVICLRSSLEELPMCELFEQQMAGVPVETGHEAYERLTGKIFLDERTPLHLLVSHACLSSRLYVRMKRCVSAVVAAVALLAALPVMALIALSIYLAEGGPVLFVQERVGLHGRPFRLLKFRSMSVEKGTSSEWERDNEKRITPLGRWLRRLHLDELPQLCNILLGDMDLIGPRPHPLSNYELFARSIPYYSLRSLVRPGLTGWAQVRQGYAHDLPSEIEKMRYDLCAIARPSLLRDLWVLVATLETVLAGHPPLERQAFLTAETTDRGESVALPVDAQRVFSFQALAKRQNLGLPSYPDKSIVRAYSANPAMASVRRWGAQLVAAVVLLFIVEETLRLIAQSWTNMPPKPSLSSTAMAPGPRLPTSLTTTETAMGTEARVSTSPTIAAATTPSDLASLDAAAAWARTVVRRYEISNAKVLKFVRTKRIGAESFVVDGAKPRYHAEVRVEIPRRVGKPIRRSYFVTLQYVGSGEWEIERATFATIY